MNESEKERLIKKDLVSIENRIRHAFNQGYEMGVKKSKEQGDDEELDFVPEHKKIPCTMIIGKPCEDAVSRQAVMDCFKKWQPYMATRLFDFEKELSALPSVSPQQRSGRWIPTGYDGYADGNPVYDWWECSECGWEHTGDEESLTAFCPNCGAKMEVEENV